MIKAKRKKTIPVQVGTIAIGGNNPIAIQSMTNSDTNDVAATVGQVKRLAETGADLVRITVPSMQEVLKMSQIKSSLKCDGYSLPLIADVHFNPKVAEAMASVVEKVRINPGNYVDKRNFKQLEYSDAEYRASLEKMSLRAAPLLAICKDRGTVIRIGTNHGSLCDRIVSRYGNTPLAMAMSAMEWVDICRQYDFHNIVLSMKSSNVNSMIESTLLLSELMEKSGYEYPLHIGVTEAGAGMEGRVKSAAGIGALLLCGVGDTIRVSLTEKPENEIPFARLILDAIDALEDDFYSLDENGLLTFSHPETNAEMLMAEVAAVCGFESYHKRVKDLVILNPFFSKQDNENLALAVLQACRLKMSKTEFISCPSCGRTQYEIEKVLALVKERFSDYPGLKIGVMGCIVNGPGEMADAHFGLVGATKGLVAVYKGKNRISDIISVESALDLLEREIEKLNF